MTELGSGATSIENGVTATDCEAALPAASKAVTVYVYLRPLVRPWSRSDVAGAPLYTARGAAPGAPGARTTDTDRVSADGFQASEAVVSPPLAVRPESEGGV